MKRIITLILFTVFMIFGCKTGETPESISKKFISPDSITLASSYKTNEKPDYEWVTKSTIIYDEERVKEFLRVTHIFDDPNAQTEVDNAAFYMNSVPKAMYHKIGLNEKWVKSNREEVDEYTTINRIFKSLSSDLKEIEKHDKGENKRVFSTENTASELSKKDNYFKTYKEDDRIKTEFIVNKKDDKYFIEDATIEVSRLDSPYIVNKYIVIDINKVNSIDYSPDLVRLLVRDKVKNYTFKEK